MGAIRYIEKVSAASGVAVCDILSRSRLRSVVTARELCCFLLKRAGYSLHEIGRALGINHSTAHQAARTFSGLLYTKDPMALRYYQALDNRGMAKAGKRVCAF